jgi:tRNA pseudouridine13 synthase
MISTLPPINIGTNYPSKLCGNPECFQVSEIHIGGIKALEAEKKSQQTHGKITFGVLFKKNISTINAIFYLKKHLQTKLIKHGGLKDAHSISWQFISIEGNVGEIHGKNFLFSPICKRYTHMSTKEVWGNMFKMHLKNLDQPLTYIDTFLTLTRVPIPAFYGPQRFGGPSNDTHQIGLYLLKKDYQKAVGLILSGKNGWYERLLTRALERSRNEQKALLSLPKPLIRLFINAYQAHIFNVALSSFMLSKTPSNIREIIVAHANSNGLPNYKSLKVAGGEFLTTYNPKQLFLMGQLAGTSLERLNDEFSEIEMELLNRDGLAPADFKTTLLGEFRGMPRQLYFWIHEPKYVVKDRDLWISFKLNRGMYATVVLAYLEHLVLQKYLYT